MPSREQCVLPSLLAARAAATPDRDFLLFEDGKVRKVEIRQQGVTADCWDRVKL